MMRHPELTKWEATLKKVFDNIDEYLENKYGKLYPLHPLRAEKGTTSSKEHDGLFNVGASFSSGFGTKYGPGYVLEIRIATLSNVDENIRDKIEKDVAIKLREELPKFFPDKDLQVVEDGNVYKIYGDLNLGDAEKE